MEDTGKLRIIPLGGLEQIGMNITVFEYRETIIIVDCGLSFPEDDMLGIDLVIPDVSYLKKNIDKVKGFVITHGHEDHIGALPYILKEINVPVYGTRLTIALIENKLKEHGLMDVTERKVVHFSDIVDFGDIQVEFIRTNHSIADAAALAIHTRMGTVVHTGDFKVDFTPVYGDPIDLIRFAELGKRGVLALMCDSTNAERPGYTNSERRVGKTFDTIFSENQKSRIIIATFASNVDRVQQIINSAYEFGRKVVIEGRSMVNVINTAAELGIIKIPENTLIDIEELDNYPGEKTTIVTTGSQGETMAALNRIARSIHKRIRLMPGDVVIFSSNPIPGNEKAVSKVINELSAKGADVIFQDAHVSGHACEEEIKLLYALTKPRYAIPVHGEFRHLKAQAKIAEAMGITKENIIILSSGQVLEFSKKSFRIAGEVQTGAVFVDGLGVGDVGNVVIRDRQRLAEDGIIIVVVAIEKETMQVLAGPDIITRGFVYIKESDEFLEEAREIISDELMKRLDSEIKDRGALKNQIRDILSAFIWRRMKRSPMIISYIQEVE